MNLSEIRVKYLSVVRSDAPLGITVHRAVFGWDANQYVAGPRIEAGDLARLDCYELVMRRRPGGEGMGQDGRRQQEGC